MIYESPEDRVAVLLSTLGIDPSHEAFEALPRDPMNRVTDLLKQYQELPPDEDEVDAVLSEFLRMLKFAKQNAPQEDVKSAETSATDFEDEEDLETDGPVFQPTGDVFRDLRRLKPVQIAGAIRDERPRTIAIVLANLPPARAGAVLQDLPPEQQNEAFLLLKNPPTPPPALLQEIVRATVEKGCRLGDEAVRDPEEESIRKLAEVLRSMDQLERGKILESLAERDAETVDQLRKMLFLFSDVVNLTDRTIQKLLAEVDSSTLTRALKNAEPEYLDRFTNNLSKRARATLLEELEYMDKVSPDDEEMARDTIADAMAALDQRGDLEME